MPTMTLREAREKRGITKAAVCSAIGVSRPTYDRYEENPDSMTVEQAKKICEFMGYTPDQIFFAPDAHETPQEQ
jgi:transcriptional regulator with XRE-family HTH domain